MSNFEPRKGERKKVPANGKLQNFIFFTHSILLERMVIAYQMLMQIFKEISLSPIK